MTAFSQTVIERGVRFGEPMATRLQVASLVRPHDWREGEGQRNIAMQIYDLFFNMKLVELV